MGNLFKYANKELSTDAFLAWLFEELGSNPDLAPHCREIFVKLGFISNEEAPENIRVALQKDKVDLILYFEINGIEHSILFENKTWSTIHSNQLERYKSLYPNCRKYIYFKIGYIDRWEHSNLGEYTPISAELFYSAILPLSPLSQIVQHYCEFLKSECIDPINKTLSLLSNSVPSAFKSAVAQRHLIGEIYEQLKETDPHLKFKKGVNKDGTPWTQLDICKREGYYDGSNETIFWRIDSRSKRTYIRLCQYSSIDSDRDDLVSTKKQRLHALRDTVNVVCHDYNLKRGKVTNKGTKESEIIIFFFDENPYSMIKEELPDLTKKIQARYYTLQ